MTSHNNDKKQKMVEMIEKEISTYKTLEREQIDYEIREVNRKFESGDLARIIALTRHKWGLTDVPHIKITINVHTLARSSNAIRHEGLKEIVTHVQSLLPEEYIASFSVGTESDTFIRVTM